jgi:hypothetical protein
MLGHGAEPRRKYGSPPNETRTSNMTSNSMGSIDQIVIRAIIAKKKLMVDSSYLRDKRIYNKECKIKIIILMNLNISRLGIPFPPHYKFT